MIAQCTRELKKRVEPGDSDCPKRSAFIDEVIARSFTGIPINNETGSGELQTRSKADVGRETGPGTASRNISEIRRSASTHGSKICTAVRQSEESASVGSSAEERA